jgi:polysaccharide deacetylase 2 family uncharacterized protein YibQ
MRKNDSEKAARGRAGQGGSERLWNLAAVLGLLLIGVILGGFIGVLLDRQGLFGGDATRQTVRILPLPAPEPAPQATRAPQPVLPRIAESPEAGTDREALEARYHAGLRDTAEEDLPLVAVPPPAASNAPLWLRNAVAAALGDGRPMIAIVLDDVGVNRRGARQAIALPGPLTLSFMTYANDLAAMTAEARAAGHELMLHVPMQPQNETIDPGPNVLRADLPPEELRQRLTWGLARYDGYVGINNHMGSRFTTSEEGMALVMAELKARGLLFLDSLTAADSLAGRAAARAGVPYAVRDIFLDNAPDDPAAIGHQLALLEQTAREEGYAVGIGHPHDATVAALRQWIPEMRARGFTLVPISAIVRHRQRLASDPQNAEAG